MEDFTNHIVPVSEDMEDFTNHIVPDSEDEEEPKKVKGIEDFPTPEKRKDSKRNKRRESEKDSGENHRRQHSKKKSKSSTVVADEQKVVPQKSAVVADEQEVVPKKTRLKEMVDSKVLQSMRDHIKEKGIKFGMIDKERVRVLLELWRAIKVAELETLHKTAVFHEELFKIT